MTVLSPTYVTIFLISRVVHFSVFLFCCIEQIMKFPSHCAFSWMDILLGSPLRFVVNHLICTI